jgi:hypothetical protein
MDCVSVGLQMWRRVNRHPLAGAPESPKIHAETHLVAPTAPRSSRQSCRYLRVPSRIQSGYLAKVPSAAPKTAPAHTSEHPKSAQNLPQTHQSHLSHYTNDASEFPWRVGCKAPKFNPLINLKNLKGEYLYAITLYQFYPQALGPFFMSFY